MNPSLIDDTTALTTLGNHIRHADRPQLIKDAINDGADEVIAQWYNQDDPTPVWVFKNNVTVRAVLDSLDYSELLDGTNGLTDRERWGFDNLMANGAYDPSNEKNRDKLVVIFDAVNHDDTRAAMLADATRYATYAEAVLKTTATGPAGGNGSAQDAAAIATYSGNLTHQEVHAALVQTA